MPSKPVHRRIAPRLASGEKRIAAGNGLPPIVKYALTVIADAEGQSRSWVIEQILLHWAQGDPRLRKLLGRGAVDYVPRKTAEPDAVKAKAS
jgi:hypothetical protein